MDQELFYSIIEKREPERSQIFIDALWASFEDESIKDEETLLSELEIKQRLYIGTYESIEDFATQVVMMDNLDEAEQVVNENYQVIIDDERCMYAIFGRY